MTAQEKNLVRRAEKFDHANACAHDQTRQRRFERRYPELKRTLRAIRRYRKREKIFSALQIGANVYRERFSQLTKILGILT